MKTTAISLALILLAGTLVVPIGFSQAQVSELTVPNPPTNLNATAVSTSQINLTWTAPVNSTQDQVNGYKIEIRPSCSGSFSVLVTNTTNTTTTYSNTGLAAGICYEYKVFAHNPVGTSLASNNAIATTLNLPPPTSPPNAPKGLNVTALSNTALKLTWNAPSNTGGAPILGYKIQRNGTTIVNNTGNTQTSFTNSGLLAAHQETYRVAAWNSAGLGPYSNNATGTTKNQTSTTPTPISNLGQLVSDFVHQRNMLLKQQRDDTLRVIKECHENFKNASPENRTQVQADCKAALKAVKETYKDTRKLQQQFKDFRETAKSLIKEAKALKEIDKKDVKEFKKDLKTFEKETKKEEKIFKKEVKSEEKKIKKELKQLKKETKKAKKDKHDDDDDEDD